jgi:mannose-6-phosphate isomerase-like protein (cupin superfamily)
VKIHKTKFRFSQGDSFTVPPSNLYYIRNTSESVTASLYFVLVKDSEVPPEDE